MADNARDLAMNLVSANIRFAGDTAVFTEMVDLVEKVIRAERDAVLEELVRHADEFSDDIKGEVYYREVLKALLRRWRHVPDA